MTQTVEYVVKVNGAQQGAAQVAIVENSLKKTERTAMRAGAAMDKAAAPTRNFGHGMMQAAAFADDLQYGLKGVVNNIPGVLTGFGVGMGVAGAVQIAAVAVNQLTSKLTAYIKRQQEATQEAIKFRLTQQDQRISALSATLSLEEQFDLLQKMKGATSEYGRTQIEIATTTNKQIADVNERRRNAQEEIDRLLDVGRSRITKTVANPVETLNQAEKNRLRSMQQAVETATLETEQLAQQGMLKSEIARLNKEIAEDDEKRLKGGKKATKDNESAAKLRYDIYVAGLDEEDKALREVAKARREDAKRQRQAEARDVANEFRDMDKDRRARERAEAREQKRANDLRVREHKRALAEIAKAEQTLSDYQMGLMSSTTDQLAGSFTDYLTAKIEGQEYAEQKAIASFLSSAGQQLVASGVRGVFEGAIMSANPLTPGIGAGMIATGGAAIVAGLAMAGGGAAVNASIPTTGGSGASSAARDPGASPRGSGASSGGGGGPMIINVAYGAGGPLPEDIAREIGRVVNSGNRRRGAA